MAIYKVDNEGVAALNKVATQINEACDDLSGLLSGLKGKASDNPEGLGPHVSQLQSAIEEIETAINNSEDPAKEVCEKLCSLAGKYEEIISNNPFK